MASTMHSSFASQAPDPVSRRVFASRIARTGAGAMALPLLQRAQRLAAQDTPSGSVHAKAAIIGQTGRGNYGHAMELIFKDRPNIEVVAVADPDDQGRAQARERAGAKRAYADWKEMLDRERPQLVCLAPRWSEHRLAMGLAALDLGAHLYSEKPFTATLAEADQLIERAATSRRKIAVAHQIRLAPSVLKLHDAIQGGLIGDLIQVRAWGKQDARAGGEDMIVLGSHLFDLMRLFAGDARWCTARVLDHGRDITKADARLVAEQIGPVAGDEIEAQFAFDHGIEGSFTSRQRLRETVGHWGLEMVGSKGAARILTQIYASVYLRKPGTWTESGRDAHWERWPEDPGIGLSASARSTEEGNRRLVDDWLAAIREDREPVCSGRAAMKSLEMNMAVYHAALSGRRVELPLADRTHPLG